MLEISDFKIVEQIPTDGTTQTYKIMTPQRFGIQEPYTSLQVFDSLLNESDFSRVCHHLASGNKAESPYLSQVFEVGQSNGKFYVTSQFSENSLQSPPSNLSRVSVLQAVADACDGAHSLHQIGMAHTDINLENIKLDTQNTLANLGILSVINPGQTYSAIAAVAPIEYQSPERIQGGKPSRASDIWSLGVALHNSLTAQSIFPDLPQDSLLLSAARHILSVNPTMSDSLQNGERNIIEKSLATDPSQRYLTAAEMSEDIRQEATRQNGIGAL